ncbi:MAG: transketolase, partial [Planctomycetota bacterium]|nr:transketolase [Planctomycetota bacterium]
YSFPLNAAPILDKASQSGHGVLCVEDNYGGGLGGAVAEAAAESGGVRVESMTCRRIPKSAKTPEAILSYMGLGPSDIADRAKQFVG